MNQNAARWMRFGFKVARFFAFLFFVVIITALSYRAFKQRSLRSATRIETQNGIESLEKVTLNGSDQWIYMRGHDRNNPVLLFLHGGPGFPEMPIAREFGLELEKHFTVVHWDQRASGKSRAEPYAEDSLTIDQFLADTEALINLLRDRFDEDRVYLLGHSWGSILGAYTARDHPELLHAYIGMGQVVNIVENEAISYRFTVEAAEADGNEKALAQLAPLTPPYDENPAELFIQRKWLTKYRGGMWSKDLSLPGLAGLILISPEYSLLDFVRYCESALGLAKLMFPQLATVDLPRQVPRIDVPVYFLVGRHDYNTPFELVEQYYEVLDAPSKEIIWFEESAHWPNLEEPEKFQNAIINKILRETRPK